MRKWLWLVGPVLFVSCGGNADSGSEDSCRGSDCRSPRDAGPSDDDSADDDSSADDDADDDDSPADDDADDDDSPADDDSADDDAPAADDDADDDDSPADDDSADDDAPLGDCSYPVDTDVVAEFAVPGADGDDGSDFFRLPFPNDIRRFEDGTVDLSAFPARTAIAQAFVDAVDGTLHGFGNYQTITLRFSGLVDYQSFAERVFFVDVTDPTAAVDVRHSYVYSAAGGAYVCHDSLSVRMLDGRPLEPGHTYAVGVRTGLLGYDGTEVVPSPHFSALLEASTPDDPALARAHVAYAPLREYLEHGDGAAGDLLTAAVFTTEDPRADLTALAERVASEPVPEFSAWVRCGDGPSPCPDVTGSRDCGPAHEAYDEYHALVRLPVFQQGDPPYFQAGGDIDFTGAVRHEDVCVAVAVPKSAPPAAGHPLVLFGHGAGGSFRSALSESVAGSLARHALEDGTPQGLATLGFDQVAHGPRRGSGVGATFDPELLLFNLLNPASARGTTLQAGADALGIARAARALEIPASATGGDAIRFDTEHLAYWGHSQGGSQGAIALPLSDDLHAAVLSGTGAGILHALIDRTQPPEIPIAVRDSVADVGDDGELVRGGIRHPLLSVLQHWVDAVDPLHFARHIVSTPLPGHRPKHLFAPYGVGDSYSPPRNLQNLLLTAGLQGVAAAAPSDAKDDLGPELGLGLASNVVVGEELFTGGFRQYGAGEGSDGHFVAFDVAEANADVVRFLAQAASGATPEIGSPD